MNSQSTDQLVGPLYDRLVAFAGTDEAVAVVAARLYDRILGPVDGDPDLDGDLELVRFFRDADGRLIDRTRVQQHMTHFLMAALGGPQRYTGRMMAAAHAGRHITDEAFDRVVGHVVAVLQSLQVPAEWIAEIGTAVAPLRDSVVTARPAPVR
jgi:hemoglobin